MWVLRTVETDDDETLTFRLLPGGMKTFGRAQTADFTLDRGLVSRLHCRIINTDGRLEVEDLDSTNGTFVNGQQVKRKVLAAGDKLRIGRVELTVAEEQAEG
ncbi:MAG: FHA domain-containing protein [Vicinamibacterales bacterium]|jgi:pSer/pThr/pTyr-binding forkhead associated (FHA) protein|nr:FHA domain-containing protein [Vicinamibacterales bacterium]|tara:strand:+ start:5152 stop:5457 length:306 start_codon:yes stop_codon:yes gene_type:complete